MQIEIFTICDNAQVYAGKAVITGAFNRVVVNQLPYRINLTLAARVTFEQSEFGDKKFILKLQNPDGTNLVPDLKFDAKLNAPEGKMEMLSTLDLNLGLGNISFNQEGLYTVTMNIDDKDYVLKFLVKLN